MVFIFDYHLKSHSHPRMVTFSVSRHRGSPALLHEKSAFVLFTKSFVSKSFPPLQQDHLFAHIAKHNKQKLLSCIH